MRRLCIALVLVVMILGAYCGFLQWQLNKQSDRISGNAKVTEDRVLSGAMAHDAILKRLDAIDHRGAE